MGIFLSGRAFGQPSKLLGFMTRRSKSSTYCPEVRQWAKYDVSSGNFVLVRTMRCGWLSRWGQWGRTVPRESTYWIQLIIQVCFHLGETIIIIYSRQKLGNTLNFIIGVANHIGGWRHPSTAWYAACTLPPNIHLPAWNMQWEPAL